MTVRTLFDKIWDAHVVVRRDDGLCLLYIDRHYFHEGSFHAFNQIAARGIGLRRPDLTFGFGDHYAPTIGRSTDVVADPEIRGIIGTQAGTTLAAAGRLRYESEFAEAQVVERWRRFLATAEKASAEKS